MLEDDHRLPHWRQTSRLAMLLLAGVVALIVALTVATDTLDGLTLIGFPIGFFLAAQGATIAFIAAGFWFAGHQERLDRAHGATEES